MSATTVTTDRILVDVRDVLDACDDALVERLESLLPADAFALACTDDAARGAMVRLRPWDPDRQWSPGLVLDDDGVYTLLADYSTATLLWSPAAVRTVNRHGGPRP